MSKKLYLFSVAPYRLYARILFLSCFITLMIVAVINILVDPYLYFHSPTISYFNKIKPEYEKNLMLSKAAEAKFINAKVIFLGSSRVMSGLDISHFILGNHQKIYNLGLPGINMYQLMKYFKYALIHQKNIEKAIVGIDFFMFNENLKNLETFDELRLDSKLNIQDLIDSSLSLNTFKASITTVAANIHPQKTFISKESTYYKFQRWLTNFLKFEGFYKTYNLSQARLKDFQSIVDICRKNNIDIKIFISPTHATQYEAIAVSGLWSTFEQWKREIVKITPVWDFATYNSITTEPISDHMVNYIDNSHYSQYTGNLVLNKILSYQLETVPSDFGILITSDNIESHLREIRDEHQKWQQNNPKEVKLVHQLKSKMDSQ